MLWEPLLRGKFDRYYDKVTMARLWGRVKQLVDSREGSGEVLGYVNGGFVTIVDALADRIVRPHRDHLFPSADVATLDTP